MGMLLHRHSVSRETAAVTATPKKATAAKKTTTPKKATAAKKTTAPKKAETVTEE